MIPELFLACALSVAPLSFTHDSNALAAQGVSFSKFLHTENRRLLFVGGQPEVVKLFRYHGMAAFGVVPDGINGVTPWHAIADVGKLAFRNATFHSVYWCAEKVVWQDDGFNEMVDALRLIEPGGYFLFDSGVWIHWPVWLKGRGWERTPFTFLGFSMWQRRTQDDHHFRRSA